MTQQVFGEKSLVLDDFMKSLSMPYSSAKMKKSIPISQVFYAFTRNGISANDFKAAYKNLVKRRVFLNGIPATG